MNDDLFIPSERELPSGRLQRRKEHLVSEVGRSFVAPSRRRRRRFLGALLPAAVLLLAATGIATYVLTREATHLESIGCYDSLSLEANTTIVSADGRDPVAVCAEVWQEGAVGSGAAPELAACVLPSGAVGVFPAAGRDTCNSLGLANLREGFTTETKRLAELRDSVVGRLALDCVGETEGRRLVEDALNARGFGDWRVEVASDGYSADRPCTHFGTDAAQELALLLPTERVQIACYEAAKLPSDPVFAQADGTDPIALCARLWREGKLEGARPSVVCLFHGTAAGVFPAARPEICSELGPSVSRFPQD